MHLLVTLSLLGILNLCSSSLIYQGIWKKESVSLTDLYLLRGTSYLYSSTQCAIGCLQNSNCVAIRTFVSTISQEQRLGCQLLTAEQGSSIAETDIQNFTVYFAEGCSLLTNPCNPNPCKNNGQCVPANLSNCRERPFKCICSARSEGKMCETCGQNFTGPNCNVDISNTTFLDGHYFYIHGDIRNGSDNGTDLRPDCRISSSECQRRGMQLLTIKDSQKNLTVANLKLYEDCVTCFYRLGLARSNVSDPWIWEDGSPLGNFQGWLLGNPDNLTSEENHVVFTPNWANHWVDVACDFPAYYICEYQMQPTDIK